MKRPYIICHMLTALDGKIAGASLQLAQVQPLTAAYAKIREDYRADAWAYGTTTTKEFTQNRRPVIIPSDTTVPDGDYIARRDIPFYYISIDTLGEIGWESGIFQKEGRPDAHVVEVLTESTPLSYRVYLRRQGVSYILAGKHTLDCRIAAQKLASLFGIATLLLCGGGVVNYSFLCQDSIDELSLVLAPTADGNCQTPALFSSSSFIQTPAAAAFSLEDVRRIEPDGVYLRYRRTYSTECQ